MITYCPFCNLNTAGQHQVNCPNYIIHDHEFNFTFMESQSSFMEVGMIPWSERVPMLSIHPDSASREDVARLAAELMEANHTLMALKVLLKKIDEAITYESEVQARIGFYALPMKLCLEVRAALKGLPFAELIEPKQMLAALIAEHEASRNSRSHRGLNCDCDGCRTWRHAESILEKQR